MTDWAALAAELLAPEESVTDERRAFPRTEAPKGARATLRTRHDLRALPIQLMDLSATGAGLFTPHRLTPNQFAILEIRWNNRHQPILARVAHCSPAPSSGTVRFFVGLEFEEDLPPSEGMGTPPELWLKKLRSTI